MEKERINVSNILRILGLIIDVLDGLSESVMALKDAFETIRVAQYRENDMLGNGMERFKSYLDEAIKELEGVIEKRKNLDEKIKELRKA